jgi:hypothetical protein
VRTTSQNYFRKCAQRPKTIFAKCAQRPSYDVPKLFRNVEIISENNVRR